VRQSVYDAFRAKVVRLWFRRGSSLAVERLDALRLAGAVEADLFDAVFGGRQQFLACFFSASPRS